MGDAVLSLYNNGGEYEMVYSNLPNSVLYNWHKDFDGSLMVVADKCHDGQKTIYKDVSVMKYNGYLYVWLCSNSYGNIVLKSTSKYAPPSQSGTLRCIAETTTGKSVVATVMVDGTNMHGYTPCTLNLKSGSYNLTATWSKQTLHAKNVNIKAGETVTIQFKFLPERFKAYGKEYDWPSGATHVIAYKIYNPLGKPMQSILNAIVNFDNKLMSYGWKLVKVEYDVNNDVMLVFLYDIGSVTLATVAALIVVAVIVGIIVYGWVTVTRIKADEYKEYTMSKQDIINTLTQQYKDGKLSEKDYKDLVSKVLNEPPPNSGGKTDWGEFMKYAAILAGLGIGGAMIVKAMGNRAIRETVIQLPSQVKNYAATGYGKAKEYAKKGIESLKKIRRL